MRISGRPRRIMCSVVGVTFRYDVDDRYCSNADKEGNTHKGRGGEREARDWNQYSFIELGFQRHGHARNYARESRDAIDTRSSFGRICCFRKNELTEIVFLLFLIRGSFEHWHPRMSTLGIGFALHWRRLILTLIFRIFLKTQLRREMQKV